MSSLSTLSDFFAKAQLDSWFFNLGRRVSPVTTDNFRAFEQEQIAWETPQRGEARVAIVLNDREQPLENSVVWCLALPLDETGKLMPEPRDGLLRRIAEQLGERPQGEALSDPLKDNPLSFKPDGFTRAALHARAGLLLGLPASERMSDAHQYFTRPESEIEWSTLDYQSVADMCVRLDAAGANAMASRIAELPSQPLEALCRLLEQLPSDNEALLKALSARASKNDDQRLPCLRALLSASSPVAGQALDTMLEGTPSTEELAVVSARGWHLLEHETRLAHYLDALARHPDVDFAACIKDLAQLPRLRLLVIMTLRNSPRDSVITQRLDEALGQR